MTSSVDILMEEGFAIQIEIIARQAIAETAKQRFVTAQRELSDSNASVSRAVERLKATKAAIEIIATRDDIPPATFIDMLEKAERG